MKLRDLCRKIRNKSLLILCSCTLLISSGCDSLNKDRRVILVLIDYSASSSNDVLDKYINIINKEVFSNLGQYDCLIVMPIDEGSKNEPVKLVYEDMIEKKFSGKSDGFAHAQDSLSSRMKKYIDKTIPTINSVLHDQRTVRKRYTNYTDIVGALQQTDEMFDKKNNDPVQKKVWDFVIGKPNFKVENVLVLLSDMIQESQECNFNNRIGITERKSNLYIQGLKNQSRIPNLKDCKVFVIGSTGKNSRQIDNIKNFWTSYFRTSNAELKAYGYDVDDKLNKFMTNVSY